MSGMYRDRVKKKRISLQRVVQLISAVLVNGYMIGFQKGKIFTGGTKAVCVPVLNCYSCPGALGACPIGALQSSLGGFGRQFPFYTLGLLMLFGVVLGRVACGLLCPFGLVQDLLHKIPLGKKLRRLPGEKALRLLRFLVLLVFVVLLPLYAVDFIGQGQPWFCKAICPAGTLTAGLPLVAMNDSLREAVGWLFAWKNLVLVVLVVLSVFLWRPFCRYLCPLGAVYGLFNPIAFRRFRVEEEKCTSCGACQKACKLDIPVWKAPNSPDCVRCGECQRACPHDALKQLGLWPRKMPLPRKE